MSRFYVEVISEDLIQLWQTEPDGAESFDPEPPPPIMLTSSVTNCRFAELLKLDGKQIEVDLEKKSWKTV